MGWLSKAWKKIKKWVAVILIVIAVVIAIYVSWAYFGATAFTWSSTAFEIGSTAITYSQLAYAAVGAIALAYVTQPTAAQQALNSVSNAVGRSVGAIAGFAAGTIATAAGSAITSAGGGLGGVFTIFLVGAGGYLLYQFLKDDE